MSVLMHNDEIIAGLVPKEESVSVTADGIKTISTLLNDLFDKVSLSKITSKSYISYGTRYFSLNTIQNGKLYYSRAFGVASTQYIVNFELAPNGGSQEVDWSIKTTGNTVTISTDIPSSGTTITLYY